MAQVVFDWRELPESELALFEYPSSGHVRSLVTTDCTVQDALVTLHHNIQQIKTGGGDVEKAFQGARDAAGFICRAYSSLEHVKWPLQGRIASELIRRLDKQLQLYQHDLRGDGNPTSCLRDDADGEASQCRDQVEEPRK